MLLTEKLKKELGQAILEFCALRYVCITPKNGFYLIKAPGVTLGAEKVETGRFVHFETLFNGASITDINTDSCVIFHNGKLYQRGKDKIVESYLLKYETKIYQSPEFLLSNYFIRYTKKIKLKALKGWNSKEFGESIVTTFDCLQARKDVKLKPSKYFKNICILLREIGLLKNNPKMVCDNYTKVINRIALIELKKYSGVKRLPIKEIQKVLFEKIDKLNALGTTKKAYWSNVKVWRFYKKYVDK